MTTVPNCNTLITTGVNLQDLPPIMASVREAVRLHAQDNSYNLYPTAFVCSHCGNAHSLTAEEIRDILFRGAGQVDFVATYNEFFALVNGIPAAQPGSGFTNGVATGTELEIAHVVDPSLAPAPLTAPEAETDSEVEGDQTNDGEILNEAGV